MGFLHTRELEDAFKERLKEATHVYIAVAWARHECPVICALEEAVKNENVHLEFVVGLSGTVTTPSFLEKFSALQQHTQRCELKEGKANKTFHPKVYIFKNKHKPNEAWSWVGSANMTFPAFNKNKDETINENEEVIYEFKDSSGESIKWFKDIFDRSEIINDTIIFKYKEKYDQKRDRPLSERVPSGRGDTKNKPTPRKHRKSPSGHKKISTNDPSHPKNLIFDGMTWREFIDALQESNARWKTRSNGKFSALGENTSWFDTMRYVQDRSLMKIEWDDSMRDKYWDAIFAIKGKHKGHDFRLYGNCRSSVSINNSSKSIRDFEKIKKIKTALDKFTSVPREDDIITAAIVALGEIAGKDISGIKNIKGAGPAVATRLLTLARPDVAVSVNGHFILKIQGESWSEFDWTKSVDEEYKQNYRALLKWVHRQPWCKDPDPCNSREEKISSMRVALIDPFAYAGK